MEKQQIIRAAYLPLIFTAFLLSSCGEEVLDFRNAQINNGSVYAGNSNKPFSGKVTNVPVGTVFNGQKGYAKLVSVANTAIKYSQVVSFDGPVIFLKSIHDDSWICDAHSSDGALDGKAVCKIAKSEILRIEAKFSGGNLEGPISLNNQNGTKPVLEAFFKAGVPDGKMKIYSNANGNLIHTAIWDAGVLNGEEEGFDESTGNRTLRATLVNGTYDGEFTRFAPDGKTLLLKINYSNGLLNGEFEGFDPEKGIKEIRRYANGKLHGLAQAWDMSGKLLGERTYENGVDVAIIKAEEEHQAESQRKEEEKYKLISEMERAVEEGKEGELRMCVETMVMKISGYQHRYSESNDSLATLLKRVMNRINYCKANPQPQQWMNKHWSEYDE
ncbi:hypothetical protein [Azonexus sp.]|jgi:antitoxin component YwqK of YwqJK toxin-antitoxin module|uniref:toxin-antitoxin system YwqK family antitoxin n=1 Tax=Azonexus sp. TaxID=1872668 RepID=UPI0028380FFE|nr:hypothetical protein [Azonexus sp.]MDR1994903.1 hypothetical protein [Azonexus sp.]